MQRINETFGQNFAEIYQAIQHKLEVEYIYNTNFIEGSKLPKWATEREIQDMLKDLLGLMFYSIHETSNPRIQYTDHENKPNDFWKTPLPIRLCDSQ